MSDRESWVVRGLVAGMMVVTLGFLGCAQQKPPAEEPVKEEVKSPPPPPPAPGPVRPAPAPTMAPAGGEQTYTVQKGDKGLMDIARRFGVNWKELARINNIQPPNYPIKIGQKLVIP